MNIYKTQEQNESRPLYFDNQATSMIDFRVLDAMLPYMTYQFGNPHSATHIYGQIPKQAVEKARSQIAELIGADSNEIIFKSGATESNNAAIIGLANYYSNSDKNHIITTKIEHKTVLESVEYLKREKNYIIDYVNVKETGLVDLDHLKSLISEKTLLVSIMALNNEIGVVQDLQAISDICKQNDVFFHTDAAQALGKVHIDVHKMNIDLLSITAHKMYGPKGIGALYIKKDPKVQIKPLIQGGGQENGLRSGTLAPHLCVALGMCCYLAKKEFRNDLDHVEKLFNYMLAQFTEHVGKENFQINGDIQSRYLGNMSISFKNLVGCEIQQKLLKEVALSSGAACIAEPSYVLKAISIDKSFQAGVLRLGIGRFTTQEEVEYVTSKIIQTVQQLYQEKQ